VQPATSPATSIVPEANPRAAMAPHAARDADVAKTDSNTEISAAAANDPIEVQKNRRARSARSARCFNRAS